MEGRQLSSQKDITVAVAAHKPYCMPNDKCYLPLHVGADLHPEVCLDMQGDNLGENISQKNASYSELTGMYWLWKNCGSFYKGLVHYRRHFKTIDSSKAKSKNPFDLIACSEDFKEVFDSTNSQVIVPKARNYYIDTVEAHYRHTLPGEQLDATRAALNCYCPKYIPAFEREMSGTKAHMFNMFVAEGDVFNAYCEWLFFVLEKIESSLDSTEYDAFNARWPGRISEMLLDTWLSTNDIKLAEMPTISPEPVDWIAKGSGFLAAKFFGKKYKRSF